MGLGFDNFTSFQIPHDFGFERLGKSNFDAGCIYVSDALGLVSLVT
jgi:hypothetical protein